MSLAAGTLLLIAGWWLLAAAMPAHTPVAPARRRALRIAGAMALAASLPCFIATIGVEQGPVFWTCVLMLSAGAVALVRAIGHSGPRREARRGLRPGARATRHRPASPG